MGLTSAANKVLIVDDEPNILKAIHFLLTQKGFLVEQATNGVDALQMVEQVNPGILILDVMMPGIDGFEVARRIHQQGKHPNLRIIFLTARGTQEDRFRGYETGGEIYLTKPFDNDELVQTVQEVFQYG